MGIGKFFNWKYSGTTPLNLGDRYYGQDLIRDFRYLQDLTGLLASDIMCKLPAVVLPTHGIVIQGVGDTINITAGVGYVPFSVEVPDTFAAFPPSKTSLDLTAIRVEWTAQVNLVLTGATLDGATPNYVKVKYAEANGNTRTRAKSAGSYSYECTPSFTITTTAVAPTAYELCLATFTGNGAGTVTITKNPYQKSILDHKPKPFPEGLLVKRNAAHPDHQLDITFTQLWVQGLWATPATYTVDIASAGANGLDTGAEAANTWYYVWIIMKEDGTTASLLSVSSTAPTMPATYIRKRLVSMVRNGAADFVDFVQQNDLYKYATAQVVKNENVFVDYTGAPIDISQWVPLLVFQITVSVTCQSLDTTTGTGNYINIYDIINGVQTINGLFQGGITGTTVTCYNTGNPTIKTTSRTFVYTSVDRLSATSVSTDSAVRGFIIPFLEGIC